MATAEILARLRLNANNFNPELGKVLGDAERKFGSTGSVIGRNLSEGIGGGLQQAAGRVPVLGGALAGLSGPALLAGASIGAIVAVIGKGIAEAETMAKEVRKLDAAIEATGNRTGLLRSELLGLADDLEGKFAIDATEIIAAEATLTTFRNVAGDTFKEVLELSQDMSVLWGGDMASNAEKLGQALQNLGNGDVEGLKRGFKGLGTETLETIENLAKLGRKADAQAALLKALEDRIGGAGEEAGKGVSGAMFRLEDAIADATREFVEQTGIYGAVESGLDSLAVKVATLAEEMKEMNGIELTGSFVAWLAALANPGVALGSLIGSSISARLKGGNSSAPPANDNGFRFGSTPAGAFRFGAGGAGYTWPGTQGTPAPPAEAAAARGQIFRPGWLGELAIEHEIKIPEPPKDDQKEKSRSAREAYEAFKKALALEGLVPTSGFRTFEQQAELYRRLGPGNAAAPGKSDHEFYGAFDFGPNVDRVKLARAAARAGVTLGPELVHGKNRHLHQTFTDGRSTGGGEEEVAKRNKDAAEAAEKLARTRQQAEERVAETIADQREDLELQLRVGELRRQGLEDQAEIEEAIAQLRQRILPLIEEQAKFDQEGAAAAREQLAVLEAMTVERVRQGQAAEKDKERQRELADAAEKAEREVREQLERRRDEEREQIQDLADFYERAFRSGGKSILQDFEDQALAMIANIAAQWTLALLSGQKVGLPDILGQISGQGGGGGPLGSILQMLTGGGSFGTPGFGGGGGPDLGLFAQQVAGNYGRLGVMPGDLPMPGGAGAPAGGLGGIAGSLGQAVPPLAAAIMLNSLANDLFGNDQVKNGKIFGLISPLLTTMFGSALRGSASLGFDGSGGLGVGATRGNSKQRIGAATDAVSGLADMLEQIADALGGDIAPVQGVSFGLRKKD